MRHLTLIKAAKKIAALACVIGLVACVTEPASLSSQASISAKTSKIGQVENVNISTLEDRRSKGAVLTDMYGRPMSGVDFIEWLENSLTSRGFTIEPMDEAAPEMCNIDLALRRAEIGAQATSKMSSVVFSARKTGSEDDEQVFRGRHSNMNWASTSGETNGMLSRALDDALLGVIGLCD
ncbi:MAG: hypothetical protein P8H62_01485 [Henriciella sp.]|nr:hypothetical protein [Henriciella sp.]